MAVRGRRGGLRSVIEGVSEFILIWGYVGDKVGWDRRRLGAAGRRRINGWMDHERVMI